jgi:hypothetical protein
MIGFARHRDEIVTQTALLTGHMSGADLTVPVPTCPGWNVSQLLRHVEGGHRWAREIVAARAPEPPSDVALRDLSTVADKDPGALSDRRMDGTRFSAFSFRGSPVDA